MTFSRRNELAREKGWRSYGAQRYWTAHDNARLWQLVARLCPEHEPERSGSMMCGHLNATVNPLDQPRDGTWQARLAALRRRGAEGAR